MGYASVNYKHRITREDLERHGNDVIAALRKLDSGRRYEMIYSLDPQSSRQKLVIKRVKFGLFRSEAAELFSSTANSIQHSLGAVVNEMDQRGIAALLREGLKP